MDWRFGGLISQSNLQSPIPQSSILVSDRAEPLAQLSAGLPPGRLIVVPARGVAPLCPGVTFVRTAGRREALFERLQVLVGELTKPILVELRVPRQRVLRDRHVQEAAARVDRRMTDRQQEPARPEPAVRIDDDVVDPPGLRVDDEAVDPSELLLRRSSHLETVVI